MSDTWPDYDMPASVGGSEPPTGDTTRATPGAPAAEPSAPGSDTPAPTAGAADDGQQPGVEPGIPKYRFDEVSETLRTAQEQNRALMGQLAQMTSVLQRLNASPQPGQQPPQLDEREQRIVAQLDRLIRFSPAWQQLAPILERAELLVGLANEHPQRAQAEADHWNGVAQRTLGTVLTSAAEAFMGVGKQAADLEPERAEVIKRAFTTYVQRDPQRIARYEAQDPSLVKDFIGWFRGWVGNGGRPPVDPAARSAAAAQQRRGEAVRRLPTAGPTGQPVSSAPPKVNPLDEEAVHSAGWAAFQQTVNASR